MKGNLEILLALIYFFLFLLDTTGGHKACRPHSYAEIAC